MAYQERSTQSYGSRLIASIGGAVLGVVLFLASFVVLFWNEGHAVHAAKDLEEAAKTVVPVSADKVDPANDNHLVHLTGKATTEETPTDPDFGVSAKNDIKLIRTVEMYQWKQETKTEKVKKVGGGEETITTYTFKEVWSDAPIDSSTFNKEAKKKDGIGDNPEMPFRSNKWPAGKVTVGAFELVASLTDAIAQAKDLPVSEGSAKPPEGYKVNQGGFYKGKEPDAPEIGDMRVSYKVVEPQTVSVVAKQAGSKLDKHIGSSGTDISMLKEGEHDAKSMFETAQKELAQFTWVLRFVGFALMAGGLFLVFKPLSVMGDVIPFIGNAMGVVLGLVAGMIAFGLSLITISIAWVVYRPLIGIPLLLVGVAGLAAAVYFLVRSKKAAPAPAGKP
jgi:Transmembrane protein 43